MITADHRCPQRLHPSAIQSRYINMLSISPTYLLYYVPLIISIALVFGATRHEDTTLILRHAWQTGRWITGFMGIIFVVLCFLDWMI